MCCLFKGSWALLFTGTIRNAGITRPPDVIPFMILPGFGYPSSYQCCGLDACPYWSGSFRCLRNSDRRPKKSRPTPWSSCIGVRNRCIAESADNPPRQGGCLITVKGCSAVQTARPSHPAGRGYRKTSLHGAGRIGVLASWFPSKLDFRPNLIFGLSSIST